MSVHSRSDLAADINDDFNCSLHGRVCAGNQAGVTRRRPPRASLARRAVLILTTSLPTGAPAIHTRLAPATRDGAPRARDLRRPRGRRGHRVDDDRARGVSDVGEAVRRAQPTERVDEATRRATDRPRSAKRSSASGWCSKTPVSERVVASRRVLVVPTEARVAPLRTRRRRPSRRRPARPGPSHPRRHPSRCGARLPSLFSTRSERSRP